MSLLSGIKVLDLSALLPGPYCSMVLADLGAEVLKVERPGTGDPARNMMGNMFWTANRNKSSITLDLKSAQGKEICLRLAKEADVFLEGFRPGVMERLGLDYQTISQVNPGIVYCSISGFGQTGPYRLWPGHDINYLALGGALSIPGDVEFPPGRPGVPIGDLSSSLYAAFTIVAALLAREKNGGKGDCLDVSITDCIASWTSVRIGEYLNGRRMLPPEEMPHLSPVNKAFETKDGKMLAMGVVEEVFWQSFCRVIGREEWATNPELATYELRNKNRHLILPDLKAIFRSKTREEWIKVFGEADVPCAPAYDAAELCQDPHLRERGVIREDGEYTFITFPVKMASQPSTPCNLPPKVGQDTMRVLQELGFGEAEIAELQAKKVV